MRREEEPIDRGEHEELGGHQDQYVAPDRPRQNRRSDIWRRRSAAPAMRHKTGRPERNHAAAPLSGTSLAPRAPTTNATIAPGQSVSPVKQAKNRRELLRVSNFITRSFEWTWRFPLLNTRITGQEWRNPWSNFLTRQFGSRAWFPLLNRRKTGEKSTVHEGSRNFLARTDRSIPTSAILLSFDSMENISEPIPDRNL